MHQSPLLVFLRLICSASNSLWPPIICTGWWSLLLKFITWFIIRHNRLRVSNMIIPHPPSKSPDSPELSRRGKQNQKYPVSMHQSLYLTEMSRNQICIRIIWVSVNWPLRSVWLGWVNSIMEKLQLSIIVATCQTLFRLALCCSRRHLGFNFTLVKRSTGDLFASG